MSHFNAKNSSLASQKYKNSRYKPYDNRITAGNI